MSNRNQSIQPQANLATGASAVKFAGILQELKSLDPSKAKPPAINFIEQDPLTGLPNRKFLIDRLNLAVSGKTPGLQYNALLFLNLEKSNEVKNALGQDYRNILLPEIANRLKACVAERHIVAHLNAEDFAVLIEDISVSKSYASQYVADVAERIRTSLSRPYQLDDRLYAFSPSIGVCLFCNDGMFTLKV